MFERYLSALQYPRVGQLNIDGKQSVIDPKDFRGFIMWLEDQKIRFLPIDEREPLRRINAPDEWNPAYEKYKQDIGLPLNLKTKHEQISWLLLYAIRLEYIDNADHYRPVTSAKKLDEEAKKTSVPEVQSTNPFDSFDFTSADFEEGSWKLAERLGIAYHPDHLIALQAAAKVISSAYNKEALKEVVITGQPFPIEQGSGMGLEKDADLEQCARILRLLQIQNIRKLQTTINETIVAVQNVTADPRTDTSLGKVGMKYFCLAKMFERYLTALQYTGNQPVNIDDPKEFRSLISWLEDQKIRHYTIENRENLKQIGTVDVWDAAYDQYKTDVGLPYELETRQEQLTWLLLHAVRLEYSDNVDTYRPLSGARKVEEQKKSTAPEVKSANPFDSLDFTNAQFEEGARKLADRLGIAYHPDHLVSLRAAGRVIHDCLNKETLKEPPVAGQPYVVGAGKTGTTDKQQQNGTEPELERAAQILRLLQIQNMRSMQTTINETIVAVQNVTADPKTDTALGKDAREHAKKEIRKHDQTEDDLYISRPYTPIASDLEAGTFDVLIKLEPGGAMTNYLVTLSIGAHTEWKGLYGDFLWKRNQHRNVVAFVQGVAIAPVYSTLSTILDDSEDDTRLTLCACFRDLQSVLLREELRSMGSYWNFRYEVYLSRRTDHCPPLAVRYAEPIHDRRLEAEDTERLLERSISDGKQTLLVLLCGTEPFTAFIKSSLVKLGIENCYTF
uniref:Uncharacterized protein n=1 Tax=Anopheles dirus TaxID=7168 RepID=A0A182N501_9DIPT